MVTPAICAGELRVEGVRRCGTCLGETVLRLAAVAWAEVRRHEEVDAIAGRLPWTRYVRPASLRAVARTSYSVDPSAAGELLPALADAHRERAVRAPDDRAASTTTQADERARFSTRAIFARFACPGAVDEVNRVAISVLTPPIRGVIHQRWRPKR